MEYLELNETPVRTAKNYEINNIKLKNVFIPEKTERFNNITIKQQEKSKIKIDTEVDKFSMTYGLGDIFTNQAISNPNQKLRIVIDSSSKEELEIDFNFDKNNINLVENIEIVAQENAKASIILKYTTCEDLEYYHNGILKLYAKENSNIDIILVNLLNDKSNNFFSIDNEFVERATLNYTIVDFGGKNSISNYYSNLASNEASNVINTIYLGKENQVIDMNYIAELNGEKTNVDIDVQGALNGNAIKHFKGTIDFKKGAKKAKGNENEFCMLLSDKSKSIALPVLLCSEEDIEGNHSTAAGKVENNELFYIMSRGFEEKEAIKLMVRARFNNIINKITNENLKEEIINEIDRRLY